MSGKRFQIPGAPPGNTESAEARATRMAWDDFGRDAPFSRNRENFSSAKEYRAYIAAWDACQERRRVYNEQRRMSQVRSHEFGDRTSAETHA